MIASTVSKPASFNASFDVAKARFMIFPMRRASMGDTYSLKLGSMERAKGTSYAIGSCIHASVKGCWREICLAERIKTPLCSGDCGSLPAMTPLGKTSSKNVIAGLTRNLPYAWESFSSRVAQSRSRAVAEINTDESFPPKPKALHNTCFRAFFVGCETGTMPSSMACDQLRLTGRKPFCKARMQNTASMEPEALVVCPVNGLVDDTGGTFSPKSRIMAWLSLASLLGVPVPCALM